MTVILTGCTFTGRVTLTGTSGYPSGSTVSSAYTGDEDVISLGHQAVGVWDRSLDGKLSTSDRIKRREVPLKNRTDMQGK